MTWNGAQLVSLASRMSNEFVIVPPFGKISVYSPGEQVPNGIEGQIIGTRSRSQELRFYVKDRNSWREAPLIPIENK